MSTDQAAYPGVGAGAKPARSRTAVLRAAGSAGLAWADREAAPLALLVVYTLVTLLALPDELLQDSWLTLASGRELVENGLPTTDTLTVWTLGVEWIDQQWLAQLGFYALWVAGGIKLAMLAHVALVVATLASALVGARSLGASARSVLLVATVGILSAPLTLQMRAQSFAMPLFVWVVWLLAADSRRPSRRVYLVFPLLVLWANLHGTVVLAALFVALRGVTFGLAELRKPERHRGWIPRGLALTLLPFVCLFMSPYGFELVGYYRSLLFNPPLRAYIDEWAVSSPAPQTLVFYAGAFAAVWLLARQRARLTGFEQLAVLAAVVVGMSAIRSLTWFSLTAMLIVPSLLDGEFSERRTRLVRRAIRLGSVTTALAVSVVAVSSAAAQPDSWYTSAWPRPAGEKIAAIAASRPDLRILSDDRYADWLLWEQPQLAGRIAYDVRFELFTGEQVRALHEFRNRIGDDWRRVLEGYDLLAIDRTGQEELIAALRAHDGFELVYTAGPLVVLARS